jgi:formylglycine-generating enzyme required for sulfatase activity
MGSNENEFDRKDWEILHEVTLSDFSICKYAVTIADFEIFVNETNYSSDAETNNCSNVYDGEKWFYLHDVNWRYGIPGNLRDKTEYYHPVIHVSWNDASMFCKWLSETFGKKYRLPTEAEWEYSCRAGTTTPFNTGENISSDKVNYHGHYPYNNFKSDNYLQDTVPVYFYASNKWGIFNMHGNTYEWCLDWYNKEFYQFCKLNGKVLNPIDSNMSVDRVIRGGSWWSGAKYCRSASRYGHKPDYRDSDTGFRIVFEV